MSGGTPAIRLTGLRKSFGPVEAVAGIDLEIADGEFFSMLGPSGSGKTTVLRMIAGFELPTAGTVELSGRDVTRLAPFERDVNTVFQDYALFPHMTVLENVEYGLKVRKVGRKERRARALEALASVRLEGFESRKPSEMSGGQRQRVALARALVNRPKVLLLDEPLGALDLKLREEMQVELKQIQRDVGITFVFVTHDQREALTMSNRIAVFNRGRIEQVGTPTEIYESPTTGFVAGFVGTSNVYVGAAAQTFVGRDGYFLVRPENIRVVATGDTARDGELTVRGTVVDVQYLGTGSRLHVAVPVGDGSSADAIVDTPRTRNAPANGSEVQLAFARDDVFELPGEQSTGGATPPEPEMSGAGGHMGVTDGKGVA